MSRILLKLLAAGLLLGCSTQPKLDESGQPDPLQNTKKLFKEGHTTLYENGAFQVPMTTIHLIPPGPDAYELAAEMAGMRAHQSFKESVKHAKESVDFTKAGISKSASAASAITQGTEDAASSTRGVTRFGVNMIKSSPGVGRDIIAASVDYSGKAYGAVSTTGEAIASGSLSAGGKISESTSEASGKLWTGTLALAGSTSKGSLELSRKHATSAADRFVKGYAALPEKLGERTSAMGESMSLNHFVAAYQRSNEWRANSSEKMSDVIVSTVSNYGSDVSNTFGNVSKEFENDRSTFGLLKSLRWVVQGLFWDATIKPAGKMAGATLGYVTVNAVAFPALVTVNEGVAVANVAVQVTWNSAAAVYDVTAPTVTAAFTGLFSAVELVGGQALAGGELVAGSTLSAGTYAAGKTAAAATAGGGYVAGKAVHYVGAPLSTVGIAAGGSAIGVVTGVTGTVAGAGVATTGVAGEAVTRATGYTAAGTVLVGGSTASVVAGTALGTYELAKAVVVPAGYELGAGIVLGYGAVSQLGAQTVLLVSDASYMVLSLEGPNYVLYAIKGNVDNGENLAPGAMLDLKAMQQAGETIITVPVSQEEMNRLIDAAPKDLMVVKPVTH